MLKACTVHVVPVVGKEIQATVAYSSLRIRISASRIRNKYTLLVTDCVTTVYT